MLRGQDPTRRNHALASHPADAGTPDGTWEACCQAGVVTTCFCPADAECNYGWYSTCADGSCVYGGADACEVDAGVIDRDAGEPGTWGACCVEHRIDVCFCPAGAICNYGLFDDCGEGYCSFPGGDGCPG